ncbi:lipopolysaccharide assembly protein LapA domain-containing protein [Entomospira culicis]|uniref:DUF1049 domain-containing protein n=1 Tax=Entomospira culicis TaxID=2719989 RepID=A0A968GI68_9SPIO|nr:lipopolysaccharide assembly protein LapA domain-containing protein [Entomospira culicis]NIZ18875.1 DUF1049 domain-containing protein [Entomospira culicis]NIZ69090.1 DUF1049 domain-containing protein [Entomospira culicis]WDI37677.1 lipopolysaccharide assembly protein LapA domain-containing protein [Entomospira culicis]WDI39305.1 lipopolysaccharide assembly protein LapA domain-containing protein [Entomospira culicis]
MYKLILSTLALVLVGIFMAMNSSQRVVLNLLFTSLNDFPLALACLLFLVLGLVGSIPFFLADRIQLLQKQKQEVRRLNTYLEAARSEIKELEKRVKSQEEPLTER